MDKEKAIQQTSNTSLQNEILEYNLKLLRDIGVQEKVIKELVDQASRNNDPDIFERKQPSAEQVINVAFEWVYSDKGYAYWKYLADWVDKKSVIVPSTIPPQNHLIVADLEGRPDRLTTKYAEDYCPVCKIKYRYYKRVPACFCFAHMSKELAYVLAATLYNAETTKKATSTKFKEVMVGEYIQCDESTISKYFPGRESEKREIVNK